MLCLVDAGIPQGEVEPREEGKLQPEAKDLGNTTQEQPVQAEGWFRELQHESQGREFVQGV
mgnify:CR=1 FL=1